MNIHTPERQAHESQQEYSGRRALSKAVIRVALKGPRQAPAVSPLDVSRFFLGQHTNPARNYSRSLTAIFGARQAKKARRANRKAV